MINFCIFLIIIKMTSYYDSDPYFQGKLAEFQSNVLNFTPYASASNPDTYCFSGNAYSLKMKMSESENSTFSKYKSLRINLTGTIIKANSLCCFWWTIILGSIFIFPLFFICCDWWKRRVNRIYNVENAGYDSMLEILRSSQAEELYLMVQDNLFNRSKAEALIQALSRSRIKNFVFTNVASGFDCQNNNYSDFILYMKPIKSQILRSDISWGVKLVL